MLFNINYGALIVGFLCLPLNILFGQTFKGESVEYDPVGKRFLTSDDGVSIVQRAFDGTVSYFGQGLKASYGMEVMGGKLYAVEGGSIYVYDLATATQVKVIPIAGAIFLNGLASDGGTRLWVTDFNGNAIHQIEVADLMNPVVNVIVSNYGGQPNGIVYDGENNRLVVVSWGAAAKIKAVNLSNNAVTTLVTTSLTNIDGIDIDGQGNFYIGSWSPDKIVRYNNDFTQSVEFNPTGLNNPADICYVNSTDTLAIPSSATSSILFLGFSPVATTNSAENSLLGRVSPNPLTADSHLFFTLRKADEVSCSITDMKGSLMYEKHYGMLRIGENSISLDDFNAPKGSYFCILTVGTETQTFKLIK